MFPLLIVSPRCPIGGSPSPRQRDALPHLSIDATWPEIIFNRSRSVQHDRPGVGSNSTPTRTAGVAMAVLPIRAMPQNCSSAAARWANRASPQANSGKGGNCGPRRRLGRCSLLTRADGVAPPQPSRDAWLTVRQRSARIDDFPDRPHTACYAAKLASAAEFSQIYVPLE